MVYNVIKNGEVVKKKLSKKQAEDYCEKMNQAFMDSQEEIQKRKQKSGLPLRKNKYELYKVEVVKENVIKLTESDLMRIVKRVINENHWEEYGFNDEDTFLEDFTEADEYASELMIEMSHEFSSILNEFISSALIEEIINEYQTKFKEKYPEYTKNRENLTNDSISSLFNLSINNTDNEYISDELSNVLMELLYPKNMR